MHSKTKYFESISEFKYTFCNLFCNEFLNVICSINISIANEN